MLPSVPFTGLQVSANQCQCLLRKYSPSTPRFPAFRRGCSRLFRHSGWLPFFRILRRALLYSHSLRPPLPGGRCRGPAVPRPWQESSASFYALRKIPLLKPHWQNAAGQIRADRRRFGSFCRWFQKTVALVGEIAGLELQQPEFRECVAKTKRPACFDAGRSGRRVWFAWIWLDQRAEATFCAAGVAGIKRSGELLKASTFSRLANMKLRPECRTR